MLNFALKKIELYVNWNTPNTKLLPSKLQW